MTPVQSSHLITTVLLAFTLLTGCTTEQPAAAPTTTSRPTATTTTTTTTITTTTTTTLPPTVRVSDLPRVSDADGNPNDIKVLQRLLTATCCPRGDDGEWGPKTEESVQELRALLNLGTGGLDTALWQAVFTLDPPDSYDTVKSALHRAPLPNTAVQLTTGDATSYNYVLAANTNGNALFNWYHDTHADKNLSNWYWCTNTRPANGTFTFTWWKRTTGNIGPIVELTVTDDGLGRHDITITEKSGSLRNCDGYTPPTTTPPATNPPSSNTGSSGGSNAVCSIGMNVETCEDRLGLFPGERFPYIDCSGRGRTILWASNWWIIGVQGDYAVISKSPYECD